MLSLDADYTREDAIAEGRLVEVTHLNHATYNPFPTFVSSGLWEACRRERPTHPRGDRRRPSSVRLEGRLRQVITLLPLFRRLKRGDIGEFTMYFDSARWLRHPLPLRVVIEPEELFGRVVTVLLEGEHLDFRCPRPPCGGSFFTI